MDRQEKYSLLELYFCNWKWVRRLSRGIWVQARYLPGYDSWVKFDCHPEIFEEITKNPDYKTEDWRRK